MCVYLGYIVPLLWCTYTCVWVWVSSTRARHVCVHWSLQVQILVVAARHDSDHTVFGLVTDARRFVFLALRRDAQLQRTKRRVASWDDLRSTTGKRKRERENSCPLFLCKTEQDFVRFAILSSGTRSCH